MSGWREEIKQKRADHERGNGAEVIATQRDR
jgi:hypothetical protein